MDKTESLTMTSKALAWITPKFIEIILKKSECDESIIVKDLSTKPAVGKGENFGSEMIRASVKYTHDKSGHAVMETMSLILKIAPIDEGANKELMTKFDAFKMEISMMKSTLDAMNNMLNEKDFRPSPRFIHAELGDPSFIVMEDLAPLGYVMGDRFVGLDLQHCLLVMRNLAKFHASSVALSEKEPELQTMYNRGLFRADYPEDWKQFFISGMKTLANEIRNWPELGSHQQTYSEKLTKLSEVCYEKAIDCVNQNGCEFKVLNHGDCWFNNLLFRYDGEGKLTNHIFVDFQIPLWNSPAIDVLNFITTSLTEDVELHHIKTLLKEYLDTLKVTMSKLHCKTKPPTTEVLDKILKNYEFYGIMISCSLLPLVLLEKSDAVSYDEIVKDDDFVNPAYKGNAFRKVILRRLPAWDSHGKINL